MKKLLLLLQVLIVVPALSQAQSTLSKNVLAPQNHPLVNNDLKKIAPDKNWETAAKEYLQKQEYYFKNVDGKQLVINRKQRLSFITDGKTLTTKPIRFNPSDGNWSSTMQLTAISKGGLSVDASPAVVQAADDHLLYNYSAFDVEYNNTEKGLRQNFIVHEKPSGTEDLRVMLQISGDLKAALLNDQTLTLNDKRSGKRVLNYDGLKVWDAHHTPLIAKMELRNEHEMALVIDDSKAVYPITVDPLTHAPEWETSADGVLPGLLTNLQLQIDALYGYTVAGVGDVNNDGFDDIAVGSPAAIDVISGNTIAGAGAVFLYFGSSTGLPVVPSRTLRSATPLLNALFGFSVAAGNVVGSTVAGSINNDIIVGAPGESYTANVAGSPATATVTAGRVYVFNGLTLAAGPSAPTASVFLNGAGLFSNGILNVLGANVTINALFGFSVAAAGDMNGDGLEELVVGAPGYAGLELVPVRSGAAFVYLSSNIGTNTATRLNAPALVSLPGLVNLGGLLFGFSVDGGGAHSNNNRQTVVVGAPGGVSLGLNSLLSGTAYVYRGNAAGTNINPNNIQQLTGGGPLLGPVANLFGYKVKGVRDANGVRTGNILVGAPSGSVLSDLLPGLRLKTGNIYVFPKNSNGVSAQTITSPRGPNLLTQLLTLDINVNALFGSSMDNMYDANCDGIGDIIVGEPLSTGIGIIGANAVGGAAYIFTGNANGTYNSTPYWTLENSVSFNAGINAGSLIGYSVAGGGHTNGPLKSVRAYIGAPGKALDFSSGVLNLGNTLGTLFSFAVGDNGLGKVYGFGMACDVYINPDVNVTHVNVLVPGNVHTNDAVPTGTTYGTPVPAGTNLPGATITMNADGTYAFVSTSPGVFAYDVPVCIPDQACINSTLTITVLNTNNTLNPPVANTDIAATAVNTPVVVHSLANDAAGNVGGSLFPSSVTVVSGPLHGTATVNTLNGDITYTPAAGFVGTDTLRYNVCDNSMPAALCATAMQVFHVTGTGSGNTTLAADDFVQVGAGMIATGNVSINDTDPEGNTQTVATQTTSIPGKGTLVLNADGSYAFTPVPGFTGPVAFTYNTCDNGTPQDCASATLYILVTQIVFPDLTPTTRLANGTFVESNNTTRDFVIEVNEITGNGTDNVAAPIRVRITKSDNFNYTFDPDATTASVPGALAVNNGDWTLVTNTSVAMIFELKPANNISALNTSRFSISMQVLTGAAQGTENQTVSILNGSGKEVNFNNNAVVRILNIAN
ncbi:Ig-like domain-containing protein [Ferruginibacter sp. HRS2-29]|uniref:Ig-like domain-containing protein n=1 Tax=Ferruginibacter sp. HRS2-29 TaxID=2487334 RepID=UPI0020CED71B|nr:Ig-like domain-containing protein [Ferruginibacter sp. HRS2-29]MCP9753333.1 hypothetical protein [Ferruginibacter sp. HRS2-29]